MKTPLLLCTAISAALVLLGCADQSTTANPAPPANYKGLVDASTVSGGSAGPAPGSIRQKYQP